MTNEFSSWHLSDICLTGPISYLIHAAHAVGFHRGDRLAEEDEVETGEGLDGLVVGDVAVYLAAGLGAERIVVAGYEAVFIDEGDVPEGHVADDVVLHGCGLVLVNAWDMKQEGLASIFTNAHHGPREISVEFCYAMSLIIPVCKN